MRVRGGGGSKVKFYEEFDEIKKKLIMLIIDIFFI